jgi:hypothetical protein
MEIALLQSNLCCQSTNEVGAPFIHRPASLRRSNNISAGLTDASLHACACMHACITLCSGNQNQTLHPPSHHPPSPALLCTTVPTYLGTYVTVGSRTIRYDRYIRIKINKKGMNEPSKRATRQGRQGKARRGRSIHSPLKWEITVPREGGRDWT